MAKRRRRRRVTWFPNLGTDSENPFSDLGGRQFIQTVLSTGAANTIVAPVTFDAPTETTDSPPDRSLADIIGSEYIIERIVGNMFHNLATADVPGENFAVLVASGWFVARADNDSVDDPIGSPTLAELNQEYGPNFVNTIREPWMFRRTWLLGSGPVPTIDGGTGNGSVPTAADPVGGGPGASTRRAYPMSNVYYGTAVGGPFFDVRSNRHVSQDERLFYIQSCQTFPVDTTFTGAVTLVSYLDYRILGTLVKAKNRGAF